MLPPRRVVITGIGVVSALGPTRQAFWQGLCEGRSGIRPIETVDCTQFRFRNGAEVFGYNPADHFEEKQLTYLDRFAQYGLVAAREAQKDAGIELRGDRTAVVTGTSSGGQGSLDDGYLEVYKKGLPRVHPMTVPRVMANAAASHISMDFGITGPSFTVSTACSSSNHAIGQALWLIRNGVVDTAVAGGSEAIFVFGFLKAWEAMRVVSPDTCRPFSKDRTGMVLGEGGAMLILETLDSAKARGARIYAELAGFGMSSDAHHITQPSAEGGASAMRMALRDGGLQPEEIGYVNAHGTGTAANDATESAAILQVLGPDVAVNSTKSMHGHAMGASAAFEAAAAALALYHGVLPPTANFRVPDPECAVNLITGTARQQQVEAALSNSFAFGGLNACLAFRSIRA